MLSNTILYVSLSLQALGALFIAVVLASVWRHTARPFLRSWSRSWLAAAVTQCASLVSFTARDAFYVGHPTRVFLDLIVFTAGFAQALWLIAGARELMQGRALLERDEARLLPTALGLGVLSALFVYVIPIPTPLLALIGAARGALRTVGFGAGAVAIFRERDHGHPIARRVAAFSFAVLAVEQCWLVVQQIVGIGGPPTIAAISFAHTIAVGEPLLYFGVGLSLLVWFLEHERSATREAHEHVRHLSQHDTLTGLPNRQRFLEAVEDAVARTRQGEDRFAVFVLDVDHFKAVSDSLGHAAGDRLLAEVARRLGAAAAARDVVARLGDDEFGVLAARVTDADDAMAIARGLRERLAHPVELAGRQLDVTLSAGVAICPDHADETTTLLRRAGSAVRWAKAHGRDVTRIWHPAMDVGEQGENANPLEHLALEAALRRALEFGDRGQLVVHYQPQVDLASGKVVACEALARWYHPELGLLPPGRFIPLAESSGLIVPLGDFVLRESCRQAAEWRRDGLADLRVAVNISVRQLREDDFVEGVRRVLSDTGLAPSALELEVTESIAARAGDGTVEKLRELKALGVRVAIDDFGTGYSSLSLLRMFPVDALKIDQSFVRHIANSMDETAIATAVLALARSLNLEVVAEGVETEAQLRFLAAHNCDTWQGWLCAKPLPAEEFFERFAKEGAASP